jgi:NitT/TauT family transport system ATP-binding protein
MGEPLLSARNLAKSYQNRGRTLPVFAGVDLDISDGEIIAVLGRSGSGKSTLLRCLAGLVAPSRGEVRYRGRRLTGTNPGTATVFQNVALLPWQTVWQNVEVGLRARRVPARERAAAVRTAIGLIGLHGFESAYPRELSGGMRQRVGFARALVVEPDVLLMDEPFSALDVLTAENLRGELLELWNSGDCPTRAIVLVTHDIAEAVQLADRVLVLDEGPGATVGHRFEVTLPRPRTGHERYDALVASIYDAMTGRRNPRPADGMAPGPRVGEQPSVPPGPVGSPPDRPAVPTVPVESLVGLVDRLLAMDEPADLVRLAGALALPTDELRALADGLAILGFAEVDQRSVRLTHAGVQFGAAGPADKRSLFAAAALGIPLVRTIARQVREQQTVRADRLRALLSDRYAPEQAGRQLESATDWGRYAELYHYDADHRVYRAGSSAFLIELT